MEAEGAAIVKLREEFLNGFQQATPPETTTKGRVMPRNGPAKVLLVRS
jgi:hypothetical protein